MRTVHRRGARIALVAAIVLVLMGLVAGSAWAADIRSGDTVVIGPNEVINDDLVVSAGTVIVDGTVNGDLVVTGGQVRVGGTINGSVLFAGQSLVLDGQVAGSLYGLGASVTLGGKAALGRNVFFWGYSIEATPGSRVGMDLNAAGGQALLGGEVTRNAAFAGSALVLSGSVGGNVQAQVAEPSARTWTPPFTGPDTPALAPAGLHVEPSAQIGGQLIYRSPVEQSSNIRSQPRGGVVYEPSQPREARPTGVAAWALGWLRYFVTLLALGALAIWGLGAPFGALAGKVWHSAALSLGWGILIILAGYAAAFVAIVLIVLVAILLAALTLGGLSLAVLGGAGSAWGFGLAIFLLAVAYGSKIVIAYLLGWIVLHRLAGQPRPQPIWILLVGVAIFSLLRSIPFAGWFVDLAAALVGFGAIYLVWRDSMAGARNA